MADSLERLYRESPSQSRIRPRNGVGAPSRILGDTSVLVVDALIEDVTEFQARPEWRLACRVAASKGLCKSDLLPRFLLYVCEQYLLGNAHEITEQRLGTQIFNRPANYNPGEDNIVRSYARLLRKRLDEYFEGEGREEPLRIIIPRGGYVPTFHRNTEAQEQGSNLSIPTADNIGMIDHSDNATAQPEATVMVATTAIERPMWLVMVIGLVAGALLASAGWLGFHRLVNAKSPTPAHPIWAQLFQQNRNTLIVPADSGLGILQNLTGHLVTLEEYANRTYLSDVKPVPGIGVANLNDLTRQRYTSVVDLNVTAMLTQLPEFTASQSQIRYARSITTEDLKHSNAILLGSTHTNPWVSLFEKNLNFKLEYLPAVDQSFVLNEHPTGREQAKYFNGTTGTANHTYGAIDYLTSLDGTGHVLIVQGLNMAATQAAAETLFNSEEMEPILKQAVRSDGSVKSFELLVETSSIGATAPSAQVIATRFDPRQ